MKRVTLLAACVLAVSAGSAGAQDGKMQPTFTQRLGNLGRNLFGANDDPDDVPQHTHAAQPTKPRPRAGSVSGSTSYGTKTPRTPTSPTSAAPAARVAQKTNTVDSEEPVVADDAPPAPVEDASVTDEPPTAEATAQAGMPTSRRRGSALPPNSDRKAADVFSAPTAPPVMQDDSIAPLATEDGRPRPSPLRETPEPRMARSEHTRAPVAAGTSRAPATLVSDDPERVLITRKSPNVSIETTGPRRITIGKEATFVVTISNTGDVPASDVVVYISMPQWTEVAGAQASSGTTGVGPDKSEGYQWRITSLAARSRQELSLRIVPRKSQPFDLGVRWTCSPSSSQATVEVEEPKLQMAVAGPTDVIYGEHQIYQLTISNPGTGDAESVTIQLLPINPGDGTTATHSIGKLPAGSSKTVEIELTAKQAGRIKIQAEAMADGGLKAASSQDVLVRRANLQVVAAGPKLHYSSSPASYEIKVKNSGDATAEKVSIVATLPPETTVVSASGNGQFEAGANRIVWSADDIAAGSETAVGFKCMIKGTGANHVETTATAGDLTQTAVVTTQVMALADLVLEVNDTPGPIPVGQEVTFDVLVRNRGSNSAEQVELVAYFSDGLEPVSAEGCKYELGSGTVLFAPIKLLAAGAETAIKINAHATAAGNHRVRVELQCKPLGTRLTREDSTLFYVEDGATPANTPAGDDGPQPHLAPKR